MKKEYGVDFYKEHPKTCAPDDFWGQVKRSVNGKPVSQDQIDMIVTAILTALKPTNNDFLLDLCCGNGALTRYILDKCKGGTGVDFSEYLINVAIKNFVKKNTENFLLGDALTYAEEETFPLQYTIALCYGSFQYIPKDDSIKLLKVINNRFINIKSLFIGNLPDKSMIKSFYKNQEYYQGIEDDHTSAIGIWRTKEELSYLANKTGWNTIFSKMPENFYANKYRYDVLLVKN